MFEEFKAFTQEKFPKTAFLIVSLDEDKTVRTFAVGPKDLSDGDMIGMAEIGKGALLYRMFAKNSSVTDIAKDVSKEPVDMSPEYAN